MTASPERRAHHSGATGKTLVTPYAVGTPTRDGVVIQVRSKKKYARRYLCAITDTHTTVWMRHDEIAKANANAAH